MSEEKTPENKTETPAENSAEKSIDIVAVGNAMVDILVKTNDAFLASLGVKKGSMLLIDETKAKQLFKLFEAVEKSADSTINEMSGGCASNVAAGVSSFGGKAAFIGKVSQDTTGDHFTEKLTERGVEFSSTHVAEGKETGRSLIIVTEDGARTMCTYLGSAQEISEADIDEALIAKAKIVFISGFLFDCEKGKDAANKAIEVAKKNGCKIAFTLASDSCAKRHRSEFMDIIDNHADIVFSDHAEMLEVLEVKDIEEAKKKMIEKYKEKENIIAITDVKEGATIISKNGAIDSPAVAGAQLKDATGAGASFASGFLYAYTHGFDLEKSALLGNMSTAEVIKTFGARPTVGLKNLLAKI